LPKRRAEAPKRAGEKDRSPIRKKECDSMPIVSPIAPRSTFRASRVRINCITDACFQAYLAIITEVEASSRDERNIPNRGVRLTQRAVRAAPGRPLQADDGISRPRGAYPRPRLSTRQTSVTGLDYVAKHIMGIMQRTGGLAHSPDAATEAIRSNRNIDRQSHGRRSIT